MLLLLLLLLSGLLQVLVLLVLTGLTSLHITGAGGRVEAACRSIQRFGSSSTLGLTRIGSCCDDERNCSSNTDASGVPGAAR